MDRDLLLAAFTGSKQRLAKMNFDCSKRTQPSQRPYSYLLLGA